MDLKVKVKSLSRVQLFATPWTVAYQAPSSMGFFRQEYWSGLPFPSPGDLPNPGIEPRSPTLQADALLSEPPGKSENHLPGEHLFQKNKLKWLKSISYNMDYIQDYLQLFATSQTTAHEAPLCPWNSSGKNTGVGCYCCSVTKSCPTLCYMDYSTPGFLVLHYLLKFAQTHVIESVMPSNPLTLCFPLLLLPSIFPRIRVFSNESAVCIRWPKFWSFIFSISHSNEQDSFPLGVTGLISCCPRLSRVFSSSKMQNLQFFGIQPSLWSNSHICT